MLDHSQAAKSWQRIHVCVKGSKQRFEQQLNNVEYEQQEQLLQILRNNEDTSFGKKYQFSKIKSIEEFTQAVPIHSYEDIRPYLEEMSKNASADIICFEETGGSTQGPKLIPYNQRSLQSFQNALFPWLDDLLLDRPDIKSGTAYWSISPSMREKRFTEGGHPIGLTNDALYFGNDLAYEISQTLAVSPEVADKSNLADWRYHTLLNLLLAEDFSFISVWSPTFLLELMQAINELKDILVEGIGEKNKKRAASIASILVYKDSSVLLDTKRLWPKLDTISCWTDGAAASFILELQALFPDVNIQAKGLLATEGVVTIPMSQANSPVLAVSSGFYEFMDEQGNCKLAHQLEADKNYTVLLTNESGLYRYKLGDKVRMQGNHLGAPMLKFLGRDRSSDLCGEKLSEDFIVETFSKYDPVLGSVRFLYPEKIPHAHYILVTDDTNKPARQLSTEQLDEALCRNPQYKYAREIGQLGQLQHKVIPDIMQEYTEWQIKRGQNVGDIKPPALITEPEFICFLSKYVSRSAAKTTLECSDDDP